MEFAVSNVLRCRWTVVLACVLVFVCNLPLHDTRKTHQPATRDLILKPVHTFESGFFTKGPKTRMMLNCHGPECDEYRQRNEAPINEITCKYAQAHMNTETSKPTDEAKVVVNISPSLFRCHDRIENEIATQHYAVELRTKFQMECESYKCYAQISPGWVFVNTYLDCDSKLFLFGPSKELWSSCSVHYALFYHGDALRPRPFKFASL
mmetsp:Transcript_34654/g.91407  ORF Transcript_34654/g.91407 Transcript_34654/m.91407 type:complete len:208 (+) Transcript_34654:57-680(+)